MIRGLIGFVTVLISLLIADVIWLGSMMEGLYRPAMKTLLAPEVNYIGVVGFYLIYTLGVLGLIVLPHCDQADDKKGLSLSLKAMLFGLCAFGTYDMTALAVIRDWPLALSFIDMAWGAVTTLIAAQCGVFVLKTIGRKGPTKA